MNNFPRKEVLQLKRILANKHVVLCLVTTVVLALFIVPYFKSQVFRHPVSNLNYKDMKSTWTGDGFTVCQEYDGPLQLSTILPFLKIRTLHKYYYWRSSSLEDVPATTCLIPHGYSSKRSTLKSAFATPKTDRVFPIFILTKNRLTSLHELLFSIFQNIRSNVDIVIIDDYSTNPQMISFLVKLSNLGLKVHFREFVGMFEDNVWDRTKQIVASYISENPSVETYIVTDPDISLNTCFDGMMLEMMRQFLVAKPEVNIFGPSLRKDDWTAETYQNMHERDLEENDYVWPDNAKRFVFDGKPGFVVEVPLDTTFGMRTRNVTFYRPLMGYRMISPCSVRHHDFYYRPGAIPEDLRFYLEEERKLGKQTLTHSNWLLS